MDSCPICDRGGPLDVLCEFEHVWVTGGVLAPLPGYVCVVAKRHVREPFELPAAESAAFWSASMATARAVSNLLSPRKMNYEIHGNTIAHLHMHLFPRFDGDPYDGRPIDGRSHASQRSADDLAALATAIAAAQSSSPTSW